MIRLTILTGLTVRRLVFTVTIIASLMASAGPSIATAQTLEVCEGSIPEGALYERHWDCGGVRSVGKTFDYATLLITDPNSEASGFVYLMLVPDRPQFGGSSQAYAWESWVGDSPNLPGLYTRWTLLSDGSIRCWDPWRRAGFIIEVDPALCQ
jgi:hypothetical protein